MSTSYHDDVSQGKLASDREREWTAVLVDNYTGVAREIRVRAHDEAAAVMAVAYVMDADDSLDSLTA